MTETKITARETWKLQEELDRAEERLTNLAREEAVAQRAGAWVSSGDYLRSPEGRAVEAMRARVKAAQDEVGGVVYRIPSPNVPVLTEKLDKIVKRAAKLGVAPVSYRVDGEIERVDRDAAPWNPEDEEIRFPKSYRFVVLNAGVVKLAGWVFLATLTVEPGGVMISKIPAFARAWSLHREGVAGFERTPDRDAKDDAVVSAAQAALDAYDLGAYRDVETAVRCDHCGTVRRRTKTYLVESVETGEVKVVGSNCLRDFLGSDPNRVAKYATWLNEIVDALDEETGWGGSGGEGRATLTVEYLTHVCAMIRIHGWVSRSGYSEFTPTASEAWSNLVNYGKSDKTGRPLFDEVTPADFERATAAIEWAKTTLNETARSDFDRNMVVAASGETTPRKGDGILAYVPVAHAKYEEREIARRERAKEDAKSEWVGSVGDRVRMTTHVLSVYEKAGDYGTTFITKMKDDAGNVVKWFGSYDLGRDSVVEATWTVKGHEEFKGTKETVVNRPAKVNVIETDGVEVLFRNGDRVRWTRWNRLGKVTAVNLDAKILYVDFDEFPDEAPVPVPFDEAEPLTAADEEAERENVAGLNVPESYR